MSVVPSTTRSCFPAAADVEGDGVDSLGMAVGGGLCGMSVVAATGVSNSISRKCESISESTGLERMGRWRDGDGYSLCERIEVINDET